MSGPSNSAEKLGASLVVLQDRSGKLNFEGSKIAEAFDLSLRDAPGYIGVVPIGSLMRGDHVESSDGDVVVVRYRSGIGSEDEEAQLEHAVCERALSIVATDRTVSFVRGYVPDNALEHIIDLARRKEYEPNALWLYIFSPSAIGPGIETLRSRIASDVKQMSPEEQDLLLLGMAMSLLMGERKSQDKILQRDPQMTPAILEDIWKKRWQLWLDQIRTCLQL